MLRRLREVMAAPESAQSRLDKIVVQIAANMVAEVCSIYVVRKGGQMELMATEGLKREAIHRTFMERGEGLVGLIAAKAEPLNLPDAQSHPSFSYRPETGEEAFHSFLGVPILRSGHTVGVLVVQNRTHRRYSDEEVEALQTTAMVLAETIASLFVGEAPEEDEAEMRPAQSVRVRATAISEGLALGHVVLHEPRVIVSNPIAEYPAAERAHLTDALETLRATIDDMLARGDMAPVGEHRDVLEAYRMYAHDRGWIRRIEEAIDTGLTAEGAVERVRNDLRARMLRQTDPYLRDRLHDFDDLANRLLRILAGRAASAAEDDLPHDTILLARNMGAADLLDYDRSRLRGVVLEEGGPSSHVAIVARALDVPCVGQAQGVLDTVDPGDAAVVDGFAGEVHLRPSPDVISAYSDKARFQARRQAKYQELKDVPTQTRDGKQIQLMINAGLIVDLPHLDEAGAAGIGLFRTELQFMVSATFPRLGEQVRMYRQVFEAAGDRPVVFRSLDIGGDKMLPYMRHSKEENPALGWRAIRMALDRPGLLRTQIRALLRASAGHELHLMLPMVSQVSELEDARVLLDKERAHMRRHGHPEPTRVMLGAMIEVPALLWQLPTILPLTDFISVGSNDLLQFLFAADRSNIRLADRFDPLSPAVLRALHTVANEADAHDVPFTLCGEMAGRPLEAMALIGLGYHSISMAPASIGPVKAMILSLDASRLEQKVMGLLDAPNGSVRAELEAFAHETGVPI